MIKQYVTDPLFSDWKQLVSKAETFIDAFIL